MDQESNQDRRRPGRPRVARELKLQRRRERERAQRESERIARNKRVRPTSPFMRGFALLDSTVSKPATKSEDAAPVAEVAVVASSLTIADGRFRHELTAEQIRVASAELEAMRRHGATGLARNSRKTLLADWRHWQAFCLEFDHPLLPVEPEALIRFLGTLVDAGYKRASLEHLISTLRHVSKIYGAVDPMQPQITQKFWKDLKRERLSKRQRQATGLTDEHLQQLETVVDSERPIDVRDIAMAYLLYDLLARPSELVALHRADVLDAGTGDAVAGIKRSKADQEGIGHTIYVRPKTVEWLRAWVQLAIPEAEVLFHAIPKSAAAAKRKPSPMTPKAVGSALQRLAKRAGLEIDFSGHSGRVGAAQDMTEWGTTLPQIMQIGRWKSPAMPARYGELTAAVDLGKQRFERNSPRR